MGEWDRKSAPRPYIAPAGCPFLSPTKKNKVGGLPGRRGLVCLYGYFNKKEKGKPEGRVRPQASTQVWATAEPVGLCPGLSWVQRSCPSRGIGTLSAPAGVGVWGRGPLLALGSGVSGGLPLSPPLLLSCRPFYGGLSPFLALPTGTRTVTPRRVAFSEPTKKTRYGGCTW